MPQKFCGNVLPIIHLWAYCRRSPAALGHNGEEAGMASAKREVLDNIPLIVVAAMVVLGLASFFSVVLS